MKHPHLGVRQVLPFVPAKDFAYARKFFEELGFQETWCAEDSSLAVWQLGTFKFYLQNAYVKDWAENTMLFVEIDDFTTWWEYIKNLDLPSRYPEVKVVPPRTEYWGKEFMILDVTGVLWHFGVYN